VYQFKEGKLYPTGSGNYDDFYNINKVNDDFSNGFVETAMGALENSYTNAKTNYEQYLQEQKVAEATPEETEKTTGGEFDNLIGG
jgi:3-hydroxy-3-methylglutaryl CoA synthase